LNILPLLVHLLERTYELEGKGIGSDSKSAGTRGRAEKYGNVGEELGVLPESDEQYRLT
jgi:hypothetical protein